MAEACKRFLKNSIICWNYLYLTQKLTEMKDPVKREAFLHAVAHGSAVSWAPSKGVPMVASRVVMFTPFAHYTRSAGRKRRVDRVEIEVTECLFVLVCKNCPACRDYDDTKTGMESCISLWMFASA